MVTEEMKDLLKQIETLCCKASDEIYENDETADILNTCDSLQEKINNYLNIE